MRFRHLAPCFFLVLSGVAFGAFARPLEALLSESDQAKLGKDIAAYFEAYTEKSGVNEAFEVVRESFDKLEKKLGKKLEGDSLLKSVEDWVRIFYYSNQYTDKDVKKGKVEERVYNNERFGDYSLSVSTPKKYSAKTGPYPLLICIPPKGKKAKDHFTEDWIDPAAREEYLIAVCEMPSNDRYWSVMGEPDAHGGVDTVLFTLASVKETHAVDVDRVYLAGFGEGVAAAARIAGLFPHVFAGVVGRSGDLDDIKPANFRNLPTLFAGGGEKCTAFEAAAKAAGIENVTVRADATETDIWAWIAQQRRSANPTWVSLVPDTLTNNRAYWILVEGFELESNPKIDARVERETNTIHIESSGISTVSIYFNDELVDLSKPVKVLCNGTANQDLIPRDLQTMMLGVYKSGDWGRVYVASHVYDLPSAGE